MNNLEKFVKENRAAFDTEEVPMNLWKGIEGALPKEEKVPRIGITYWLKIASVALLFMTVGGVIGGYITKQNIEVVADNNQGTTLEAISPEYAEMEDVYNRKINTKIKKLTSYNVDNSVLEDMKELDEIHEELKIELASNHLKNKEQIVAAMIGNYQTKVEILERVLEQIELANSQKRENNEGVTL